MSWWLDVPRDEWAATVKREHGRLIASQFGKSHRLATGPNEKPDEAEAKFRRSRQEIVSDLNARKTA